MGEGQGQRRGQAPAYDLVLRGGRITAIIRDERGGGDPKNVSVSPCEFDSKLAGQNLAQVTQGRGFTVTLERPHSYAEGVSVVIVSGQVAFEGEKMTAARPGRVLLRE